MSDSFAWYFNNEPIATETVLRGNLTLSFLQTKDGGWYTCAAANRFGRAERDFLLIVGGKYDSALSLDTEEFVCISWHGVVAEVLLSLGGNWNQRCFILSLRDSALNCCFQWALTMVWNAQVWFVYVIHLHTCTAHSRLNLAWKNNDRLILFVCL